jgi:Lon protease-like protein
MSVSATTIPDGALAELPIFPLPQVVLFPHSMLPLHVFEPRYRAMLKDCLGTHKLMLVAHIVDAHDEDEHGNPRIAGVAGLGLVVEHHELADGRSNILLHGRARVALEELPFVPPYRRGRAVVVSDLATTIGPEERAALLAIASAFTSDLHRMDPSFSFRLPQNVDAATVADVCAHHLIIDANTRQRLLEERDPRQRVHLVTTELAVQHRQLRRERGGVAN